MWRKGSLTQIMVKLKQALLMDESEPSHWLSPQKVGFLILVSPEPLSEDTFLKHRILPESMFWKLAHASKIIFLWACYWMFYSYWYGAQPNSEKLKVSFSNKYKLNLTTDSNIKWIWDHSSVDFITIASVGFPNKFQIATNFKT